MTCQGLGLVAERAAGAASEGARRCVLFRCLTGFRPMLYCLLRLRADQHVGP